MFKKYLNCMLFHDSYFSNDSSRLIFVKKAEGIDFLV